MEGSFITLQGEQARADCSCRRSCRQFAEPYFMAKVGTATVAPCGFRGPVDEYGLKTYQKKVETIQTRTLCPGDIWGDGDGTPVTITITSEYSNSHGISRSDNEGEVCGQPTVTISEPDAYDQYLGINGPFPECRVPRFKKDSSTTTFESPVEPSTLIPLSVSEARAAAKNDVFRFYGHRTISVGTNVSFQKDFLDRVDPVIKLASSSYLIFKVCFPELDCGERNPSFPAGHSVTLITHDGSGGIEVELEAETERTLAPGTCSAEFGLSPPDPIVDADSDSYNRRDVTTNLWWSYYYEQPYGMGKVVGYCVDPCVFEDSHHSYSHP